MTIVTGKAIYKWYILKFLSYEDRLEIERCLKAYMTFTDIGKKLGRDRTTITKEVRNYSVERDTDTILGGGTILDVILALVKGVAIGFMCDGMCKTGLGIVMKPMMEIFGLGSQVDQIQEVIKSGDLAEIAVRFVQLICMLFGMTSQCFTGDTLVSTADGLRPIEEIQAGDYVWSENTETVLKLEVEQLDACRDLTKRLRENGYGNQGSNKRPKY